MTGVANAILFNISWLAIVLAHNAALALAVVAVHLWLHWRYISVQPREWILIAGLSAFGLAADQLLFRLGILDNATGSAWAPLWLSCLWPVFATTAMHCFRWLHGRPLLAALLGAVGGALSYRAGVMLSPVSMPDPVLGMAVIGGLWALLFPLVMGFARYLCMPVNNDEEAACATS